MRDQRARAIFWAVRPILAGKRMRIRSHCGRPQLELRHFLKPTGPPMKMIGSRNQ